MMEEISGVLITKLKKIRDSRGAVFHGIRKSNEGFHGFGELYFSSVENGVVKGWKKHLKMTMNLIPVCGEIELIIYDSREKSLTYNKSITLNIGSENYCRVTIPPGLWTAFRGKSEGLNLLANLSDIEHDPEESITVLWKDGSYPQ